MTVAKIQTETTWNVFHNNQEYTVTVMEDYTTNTLHWDVINEEGEIVTDEKVIMELVAVIEDASNA